MTEDLVVSAYQKERFTMTLTEVEERATGRRRMRWAPALAAGLAIVTAVTSWPPRRQAPP